MAITMPPVNSTGERIDWRASWIWAEGKARPRNAYLYARKTFELKGTPSNAVIYCSADSRYRLHINGVYVGQGPVPSTRGSAYFDSYDVTHLLQKGENSVAFLVHHPGEGTYSYDPACAGLICQLEVDGNVIGTDDSWKVRIATDWTADGWRISKRLGFQEVYDARLHPGDWQMADFYDEPWENATIVASANEEPWGRLIPREIPYLIEEAIRPKTVIAAHTCPPLPEQIRPSDMASFMAREEFTPLPPRAAHNLEGLTKGRSKTPVIHPPKGAGGSIILDFGKEISGHIEIRLSGWGGTIIDIGYSERLEDGRVKPDRARMRYTDRYIMRSGLQTWRSFGQRAFRYMQIDFRESPRAVGIEYIKVIQTSQPQGPGRFESNDKLLNEIWKTGSYTTQLTAQEIYMGCPWRERAQWWSDARISSHVAYYTTGDLSLLKQGLRQFSAAQKEDGSIPGICPAFIDRLIPDYSAFWVLSVWEYYAWTQDKEFLSEIYPYVVRAIEWFRKYARPDGLLKDVPGEIFIDWTHIEKRGVVTTLNCLYYECLHRAGMMATALDNTEDAASFSFSASAVRYSINRYLWSQVRGMYVDSRWDSSPEVFSPQSNILAILFDIPDHYRKAAICRQLLDHDWQAKLETPYFTSYFVEVLCRTGFYQEAIDILRKRWGDMLKAGATTFWERFTSDYSLCHVWSTGPTRHLSAEFLGVRPVVAEKKVRIAPQPADLRWAKGLVPTPHGNIEVAWRREGRRFSMRVNVPEGMTAEILPPTNGHASLVSLDGLEKRERLIQIGSGVHELKIQYRVEKFQEPRGRSKREEDSLVEILPPGGSPHEERSRKRVRKQVKKAVLPSVETPDKEKPEEPAVEKKKPAAKTARGTKTTRKKRSKPTKDAAQDTNQSTAEVVSSEVEPLKPVPPKFVETPLNAEPTQQEETVPPAKISKPRRRAGKPRKSAEIHAEFRPATSKQETASEPQPALETPVELDVKEQKPKRRTYRKRSTKKASDKSTDATNE